MFLQPFRAADLAHVSLSQVWKTFLHPFFIRTRYRFPFVDNLIRLLAEQCKLRESMNFRRTTHHFFTLVCLCGSFISLNIAAKFLLLPMWAFGVSTTPPTAILSSSPASSSSTTVGDLVRSSLGDRWIVPEGTCTSGATCCTTGGATIGRALTARTGTWVTGWTGKTGEWLLRWMSVGGLGTTKGRDLMVTTGWGRGGGGGGLGLEVKGLLRTYSFRKGPRSMGSSLGPAAAMTATGDALRIARQWVAFLEVSRKRTRWIGGGAKIEIEFHFEKKPANYSRTD